MVSPSSSSTQQHRCSHVALRGAQLLNLRGRRQPEALPRESATVHTQREAAYSSSWRVRAIATEGTRGRVEREREFWGVSLYSMAVCRRGSKVFSSSRLWAVFFLSLAAFSLSVTLSLPHARQAYAASGAQGCALRDSERSGRAQAQRSVCHGLTIGRYRQGKFGKFFTVGDSTPSLLVL